MRRITFLLIFFLINNVALAIIPVMDVGEYCGNAGCIISLYTQDGFLIYQDLGSIPVFLKTSFNGYNDFYIRKRVYPARDDGKGLKITYRFFGITKGYRAIKKEIK